MKKGITDTLIQLFNGAVVVAMICVIIGVIIFFATLFLMGACS